MYRIDIWDDDDDVYCGMYKWIRVLRRNWNYLIGDLLCYMRCVLIGIKFLLSFIIWYDRVN